MGKVETAAKFMETIAKDDSYGYDQLKRWGNPDYDCSSLVISAYEQAGIKVKSAGATYTGNMYTAFIKCGFKDVSSSISYGVGAGLKRGDVLLNKQHHTAMYLGNGKLAEAAGNEKGGIYGGTPGDQTGKEIRIQNYYNYPWDVILRYPEKTYTTYYVTSPVNYREGAGVNFTKKGEYTTGTAVEVLDGSDTKVGADTWVQLDTGYWCCKEYLSKTKPVEKNPLDVEGFKRGDKGLGVYALKRRLISLGYSMNNDTGFGSGTEKAVNALLKKWGYKENGIAGKKFLTFVMK